MIAYETKTTLSEIEKANVRALEQLVFQQDVTSRTVYLSNQFNLYADMTAFFLAYDGSALVGFAFVDADNPDEADVFLFVHPNYRQQGIGTHLVSQINAELANYQIPRARYKSEMAFINHNPWMLEQYQIDNDREFMMIADNQPGKAVQNKKLKVAEATLSDLEAIAHFQAEVFDESYDAAYRYAEGSLNDPSIFLYAFYNNGRFAGSGAVNQTGLANYFFGLAVHPDFQNQGIGSDAIALMMTDLNKRNDLPYQLSVDSNNRHAKHVYEKNGFNVVSEVIYLTRR
jgi:ribosomal protein S18 acetylase RimI-like enzyme